MPILQRCRSLTNQLLGPAVLLLAKIGSRGWRDEPTACCQKHFRVMFIFVECFCRKEQAHLAALGAFMATAGSRWIESLLLFWFSATFHRSLFFRHFVFQSHLLSSTMALISRTHLSLLLKLPAQAVERSPLNMEQGSLKTKGFVGHLYLHLFSRSLRPKWHITLQVWEPCFLV